MGEMLLSSFVQVVLDKLVSAVMERFCLDNDMEGNVRKLRGTLPMVQRVLDVAEEQLVTDGTMILWLSQLKEAVYKADGLIDEITVFELSNSNKRPRITGPKMADEMTDVILNIEKSVTMICTYHSQERGFELFHRQRRVRNTGSSVDQSKVYGRNDDIEKIVQLLLRGACEISTGDVPVICILGIGGIGKTTLAQLLHNDARITKHFHLRLWVCVSEDFEVGKIMKDAIESGTGGTCGFSGMDALQSQFKSMTERQRYLLVLDDVWNADSIESDKLMTLLRWGLQGTAVIVTSRSEKAALTIAGTTTTPYHLKGLSEADCWALFRQRAFRPGDEELHPKLVLIGKEIVKKCRGVPLAAKVLGSLMGSKKTESEWMSIQNSQLWKIERCQKEILPVLRLSYSQLPSHLKRCFAFCSIFPRCYEINKNKLIHLWMAAGLIPLDEATQEYSLYRLHRSRSEDIGNEYFDDLMKMCFFEAVQKTDDGSETDFTMHDLIHDLARSVGGNESTILHLQRDLALTRHISIDFHFNPFPEALYGATHLHTLLLLSRGDLSGAPFTRFKYLRSLVLSGCGMTELHQSIGDLLLLKYLDLSYNQINALPETICRLLFLQTLNLTGCNSLKELPDMMALKMKRLRHLNITGCLDLARLPRRIGELYELQTLPIYIVGDDDDRSISELALLDLHGELKITHLEKVGSPEEAQRGILWKKENLESLGLYWEDIDDGNAMESLMSKFFKRMRPSTSQPQTPQHDADVDADALREEVLEGLQPHPNLKQLLVRGYPGTRFSLWPLPKLTVVDLSHCKRCQLLPTLGNLPLLKILSLCGMNKVRCIGKEFYGEDTERPFFPTLTELALTDFPNLEQWITLDCRDAFPILSKLVIKKCPNLTTIPSFLSLQHLELRDCTVSILRSTAILTPISVLVLERIHGMWLLHGKLLANCSLLTSLEILSCPNLHSLPSELGNLTALKSLTIRWCKQLSSLPQSLQNLKALEYLEICDCDGLTTIPDDGFGGLTSLRILSIENCSHLSSLPSCLQCLTSLEHLTVMCCECLDSLPVELGCLPVLQSLTIFSCPRLSLLPDELHHLISLHRLEIRSCPGLTALPKHFENLSSLTCLSISDCPNLKYLPDGLRLLPRLQHLSIQDCPELQKRCSREGADWRKIEHVTYKHIGPTEAKRSKKREESTRC